MEPNSLNRFPGDAPEKNARLSPAMWTFLILVGVFALGGFVFNLGRLLTPSRARQPTAAAPRTSSNEVEINSTVSLSREAGTFTIWGDPVNRGVICARGEVFDLEYINLSPDPEVLTDMNVRKRFECQNGSGSFEMDLDVDVAENTTAGTWVITGGEGNYLNLSGSGTVEGTYLDEDLVADSYEGTVSE